MAKIVEYKDHFSKWLSRVPAKHALRVTEALYRMELGNFGDHKSVGEGVMERRIFGSPAIRIYYAMDGKELIVLLVGGTKSKQDKDIAKAKKLWGAYKSEK
ncbi:MAG TPA: type II toxin-antitoxin system RelE/ParE family toxin [Alphaproteobacteria bacterium]|nr:type II toxin-antitoxin system RelE/ParE family toxin [Alphaproteobacteria bacterium]USO05680.1 MAG: type II toxin-antitoxin system RelE/ParE family toxin [Rhodospirillales bacterium]HOO82607.1 type II toxin-antitoxin system RelE/ParE family toxin [Alphaproteobacteria bacterium]